MISLAVAAAIVTGLAAIAIPSFLAHERKAHAVQAGTFIAEGGVHVQAGLKIIERDLGNLNPDDPDERKLILTYMNDLAIGLDAGSAHHRWTSTDLPPPVWCGSGWNEVLVPDYPVGFAFAPGCREHDICYGSCGTTQAQCDNAFLDSVITRACQDEDGIDVPCTLLAHAYYFAVATAGAGPYAAGQRENGCPSP